MAAMTKDAEEAARRYAEDFLRAAKVDMDARKNKEKMQIIRGKLGVKADFGARISVTEKAQRILNRVAVAVRAGRLEADLHDKEKLRKIATKALSENRSDAMFNDLLRQAYAAGRHRQQMEDGAKPWWLYRTMRDENVRPEHRLMEAVLLPKTHPWWVGRYPPNGPRCRCRVDGFTAEAAAKLARRSKDIRTTPPTIPGETYVDKVTGATKTAPGGVTPGYETALGGSHAEDMGRLLEQQMAKLRKWEMPKPAPKPLKPAKAPAPSIGQ